MNEYGPKFPEDGSDDSGAEDDDGTGLYETVDPD